LWLPSDSGAVAIDEVKEVAGMKEVARKEGDHVPVAAGPGDPGDGPEAA
jgi:hypothetical protein